MLGRHEKEGTRAVILQASANTKGPRRAIGDSAASVLTVSCSLELANDSARARPPRVVGLVEWGTDGHQCAAHFDWVQGTVLQVACSSVRVIAELTETMVVDPDISIDYPEDAVVRVGAVVGYMPASRVPLTYTQQLRLADNGQGAGIGLVPVPPFARELRVYGPNQAPGQCEWRCGENPNYQLGQIYSPGPNLSSQVDYLVPGVASHLFIRRNDGDLYNLVWSLAL